MAVSSNALQTVESPTTAGGKPSLSALIEREGRRKHRRRWWLASFCAMLALLGGVAWLTLRPKPVAMSARFRTAGASRGDIVREVHATGYLEALTTVQVGAEISGRIESVAVDHYDRVGAGQILARFDRAALEAQRAQTRATLAAARAAVEQARTDRDRTAIDKARADLLFGDHLVSQAERDTAAANALLMRQRLADQVRRSLPTEH
jgi:HlyD family secretion protein